MSDQNTRINLAQIGKSFGRQTVLDNCNLTIDAGELLVLLGPSGCGKTTTLRIIAGLEMPDKGSVVFNDKNVTNMPMRQREVGIVFQAYSLFPHMTVEENIEYGLRVRHQAKARRQQRSGSLLDLVGLADSAEKYPRQLSGGEQQRVALARALAVEPRVLLLDEPLSALDARVRLRLREEIRAIHERTGTTTLMVTHDQEEALTVADRIGVMNGGQILQLGTPSEIYEKPASAFVTEFVGAVNRIPCERLDNDTVRVFDETVQMINSSPPGERALDALIRPEQLVMRSAGEGRARVISLTLRGATTSLRVRTDGAQAQDLRIDLPSYEAQDFRVGQAVNVSARQREVLIDARAMVTGQRDLEEV